MNKLRVFSSPFVTVTMTVTVTSGSFCVFGPDLAPTTLNASNTDQFSCPSLVKVANTKRHSKEVQKTDVCMCCPTNTRRNVSMKARTVSTSSGFNNSCRHCARSKGSVFKLPLLPEDQKDTKHRCMWQTIRTKKQLGGASWLEQHGQLANHVKGT